MRRSVLLAILSLTACGEGVKDDHFAQPPKVEAAEPAAVDPGLVPVRIGELGPSFAACNAAGTSRRLPAAEQLSVRAAPFEVARETGAVPAEARFFICSRSHDQRWLGIVYAAQGALDPACGVSRPVTARRVYDGPCRSGWVPSAFVKQIAG